MKLSIVVNHYQAPAMLKLCLSYLQEAQKYLAQENISAEIIVTDSETTPPTREMMYDSYPDIRFLAAEQNIGFGKSVNKALREAAGEYIFIINADIIIPEPEAILKLLEYAKEHPGAGIVGPKLLNLNRTLQPSAFQFYTPPTVLLRRTLLGKTPWGRQKLAQFTLQNQLSKNEDKPLAVDWLMGSALFLRKKYIEDVGHLDERFFMYMEDVDWCRRFWQKGYEVIYLPSAKVYHYHFRASKKTGGPLEPLFNKYTRIHLQSAFKYFRKHGLKNKKLARTKNPLNERSSPITIF